VGRLDGKVALITGGAGGSGAATARSFVEEGAGVAIADVASEPGKALASELGDGAHYLTLDVTSEDDWSSGVSEVRDRFGRLDVLINNAGILKFGGVEGTSLDDYMTVIRVNQIGAFLGMRTAVPAMKDAGGGSIVNVSSVEGIRGSAGLVAYCASKFAIRGMTKSAAVELGPSKIRVNAVAPGVIDTPMVRAQGLDGLDLDGLFGKIPAARVGRTEDVAGLMVFLASDESSYFTGADFVIDGGATAFIGWGGSAPVPR
jgi:3alpha(or 20beta)-hydroxysteroid dehydrogenase